MSDKGEPGMGQTISTFTFLLFALLLCLAALGEGPTLKGGVLGLCAVLSAAGAVRFRIAGWIGAGRGRR